MSAPLPPNEAARLKALRSYEILDTPAEEAFDDLTLLASQICQTPIAMVSLVDEKRQWFKSKIGIEAKETPRDIAFCAYTILDVNRVLEVPDAGADPRFAHSALVTTDAHIRFYAGAPLVSSDGHALGALCVMDRKPQTLTKEQSAALRALSRHVVAQLELRKKSRELSEEIAERECAQTLLRQQYEQLTLKKNEAERLVALGEKSRQALLSVLEDQKRTGESLRASEELFRQLTENIREVFWVTEPAKQRMLYISPAYETIWGRTCQSLYDLPKTWLDAIHPDDRKRVLQAAITKQADGTYNEEYRIIRLDGEVRWIHDRAFPVKNESGNVYRIVGVAEDITERRKLEWQYLQAQKMEGIGQLAGGVAHDFNNILGVIQMQAELLKGSRTLSAEQNEFADEICTTVQRAAALTRQLLLFSRREVFQPRDLDLSELITGTAKMLRRVLRENIQMELKLGSQPMLIHADPGMVDQILMNLAVNARDAMPNGGRLIIQASREELNDAEASKYPHARPGSFVCLAVSDTGTGIPSEVLPKIFEPFFTTKDVGKGTGLGLATVFGIVQQHQGWINVYSEIGHGTTFRIYLPLSTTKGTQKSAPVSSEKIRGGDETILLAEDDPSLRTSIRKALAQLGYRILEAPTGIKALEIWNEHHEEIKLLLTDLVMPGGMTGKSLAERLLEKDPKLKVVYMSGYSPEITGKDFPLEEGVNFLTKPFQPSKLAEIVRNNLDKSLQAHSSDTTILQ